MARVEIGKALIGHVSPGNERGKIRILSEPWWDMVEHAVREGQRLGVDIGFFNGPGWSQSGGPWIGKNQSMRYVVSHEIRVSGPTLFQGNFSPKDSLFDRIALQAFRLQGPDVSNLRLTNIKGIHADPEMDGINNLFDREKSTNFSFPEVLLTDTSSLTIDLKLHQLFNLQTITFDFLPISFLAEIKVQAPGKNGGYQTIRQFTLDRRNINFEIGPMRYDPETFSLPLSRSSDFRIIFSRITGSPGAGLKEITLGAGPMVDQSIEKQLGKMYSDPLPPWNAYLWTSQSEPEKEDLIDPEGILNLTGKIDSTGNLSWEVPAGNWILMESGMIPTGATNVPVPPEATGYECDKFTRQAIETHFEAFVGKFLKRVPPEERRSFKTVVIDSYEVGPQNWTGNFRNIFEERYGYDPIPWLPVFSGRIVGSANLSNRFLWDVRRLTADLISQVYVRRLRELSNQNGLDLWLENYGHWGFPAEFLQYGGQADLVSGEFWFENTLWDLGPLECRAASSAAHIYGKRQVFAEAFTAGFNFLQYPAIMKSRGDQMFGEGINHFVQHVSIHQPWNDRIPGVTAWFGMSYQRHNTWFEQSRIWNQYLERCHYLLQQGLPVSDICYFIGDDAPKMTGILEPALPYGYDFDFINAEVILNRFSVQDGRLVLPEGKSYQLMVLPPQETMRPQILKKIHELIQEGARVYGPPPSRSPSMENYPDADQEVQRIVKEMWGDPDEHPGPALKGNLFYREKLTKVLDRLKVEPDVICTDTTLYWTHRKKEGTDIYFLANPEEFAKSVNVSFRSAGRFPELWYPDTGGIDKLAYFDTTGNRTCVPLELDAFGSVFIVFRDDLTDHFIHAIHNDGSGELSRTNPGERPLLRYNKQDDIEIQAKIAGNYTVLFQDGGKQSVRTDSIPGPLPIQGPWQVQFPENWDVPTDTIFDHLQSWTEHAHRGIRYFSGTARYLNTVDIPVEWVESGMPLFLNLGDVKMMAEVILNGKKMGILWKEPFRLEITPAAKPGANLLEIRVTNTWWNRLVGDEKYPHGFPGSEVNHPRTFTTTKAWNADSELLPSGLMGPVRIEAERVMVIE